MAAQLYFGKDVQVVCCDTFREVVRVAESRKESDGGVMAIENSIAGSILANYNLLQKSGLRIVGEIYLQIRQHLLVNRGVQLEDIREVHSHTMALQQCYDFLDRHKWKLVETEDTALSAKHIHQHKSKHIAAIASRLAADLYDLDVLAPNILHAQEQLHPFPDAGAEGDGGLCRRGGQGFHQFSYGSFHWKPGPVPTWIADGGINLSKLQSFPIPAAISNTAFMPIWNSAPVISLKR